MLLACRCDVRSAHVCASDKFKKQFLYGGSESQSCRHCRRGNGFGGGVLNTGIDVFTGQVFTRLPDGDTHDGSAGYRPVSGNPYIDGVFIPGSIRARLKLHLTIL